MKYIMVVNIDMFFMFLGISIRFIVEISVFVFNVKILWCNFFFSYLG